jgi:hypothetical protein
MEDRKFLQHLILNRDLNVTEDGIDIVFKAKMLEMKEKEDKFIVDELYKKYQEEGTTDLYLFSRQEFEEFLKVCLPMWINNRNDLFQEIKNKIYESARIEMIGQVVSAVYDQFGYTESTRLLDSFLRNRFTVPKVGETQKKENLN